MVGIQEVSIAVASTSVVAGVVYYALQIRHQARIRQTEIETRQANLLVQIYNYYYREDFLNTENEILFQWKWKDFDEFWQKYGQKRTLKPLTSGIQWELTSRAWECL